MSTKRFSHGLAAKLQRTLLAALMAIVIFGSLPADKAHAWAYSAAQGKPGSASGSNVYISDVDISGFNMLTLQTNLGPYAWRSPGSAGSQIIRAQYYVQKWNGYAYVTITQSPYYSRQISSTQAGVRFPNLNLSPNVSTGSFRVVYGYEWFTGTGSFLGRVFVYPNLTTDHICNTPKRPCASAAGYFWIGRLY